MASNVDRPALSSCRFGRFQLDPAGRRLTDETGAVLPIAGRAFDVLEYLIRHHDRVVGKDELLSAVWSHVVVDENNLTQAVSAIRRALGDSREAPEFVATVAGRGYRFVARVEDQLQQVPEQLSKPPTALFADPSQSRSTTARYKRSHIYVVTAALAALLVAGVSIVMLRREPAPSTPPPATEAARAPLDRPTIAVLPFRASARTEASELLAQCVTDLLRNRLAAFQDAVVIGGASAAGQTDARMDMRDLDQSLRVQFLLQGSVARAGDQLRIDVQLVDTTSGSDRWSTAFERSVTDVAVIREEIAHRVADTLHIAVDPAGKDASGDAHINLDVYQLYVQGQQLMSNLTVADVDKATALFRRATILDPSFARAYLALAQGQLLASRLRSIGSRSYLELEQQLAEAPREMVAEAQQALDRSLELNPALGEAWIERASLSADPVQAEELYRKGLRLAPNYGVGYMSFSGFLFDQYRKGEAIEMIARARQIDPLTPTLHLRMAFLLMVSRSDVAGHDRLLREALAINPRFQPALTQLAVSRYEYSGEFADAVRLIEESIALDPQSDRSRYRAVRMYLDVDDPVAAAAVLRDSQRATNATVEIAQYQRDRRRAAELTRSRSAEQWLLGPFSPMAEAIRDDAVVTGDYASALKLLESQYAMGTPEGAEPRMWSRGLGLVYAHTLMLAGETQRGRKLVLSIMLQLESESVGRTEDWFSRERATAFAILGEDEKALGELAASVKTKKFYRWWYLAELDPVYEHFRGDTRFQALAEQAKEHRRAQRALVDEMRRKGEAPKRAS